MNENIVQRGTQNHCLAVHYMASLGDAAVHFANVGFDGVRSLSVVDENLGCNDARQRVNDMAARGDGVAFFQGAWDYSAGRCNIYGFDFTSYNGPRRSNPAFADHADGPQ